MKRREFLAGASGLLTAAAVSSELRAQPHTLPVIGENGALAVAERAGPDWRVPELATIQATPDRIMLYNLCTRPFRAQGPRQELERLGRKILVHNYGHGGSGWSLSWGSAAVAVGLARTTGQSRIGVVGCGAIGLTTAVAAQRAGLSVAIYAKDLPPNVRSAYATGIWSPESRICTLEHAGAFAGRWERQARTSFRMYQNLLGLPGFPVEWRDMYFLSDEPFESSLRHEVLEPEYPKFSKTLTPDLSPEPIALNEEQHPFPVPYARYAPLLHFNISAYSQYLLDQFHLAGGNIVVTELKDKNDFRALEERTVINCTGYGARELLSDDTITPVRGQTCKLIPQPEVTYGIRYGSRDVSVYPRRDGLLVQAGKPDDFGNAATEIDPQESIAAVERLGELMAGMQARRVGSAG